MCSSQNTTTLAMKHYPPDAQMDTVLDVLNLIFTGVFAFEGALSHSCTPSLPM